VAVVHATSGSLHGWLWIVFALAGDWAWLFAGPFFDLPVPPKASACQGEGWGRR
jgi:hypothetical protein